MPFMNHFKRYLFVVFAVFFPLVMLAQSESDLKELQEAYANIQDGQYSMAFPYYSKMLNYYPKDPTYNYYIGRCFLFTGKDIESAIKHLRFASTRNVSSDVYFYLGLAYLKNYEFEEAEANFKWFEKLATKKQAKNLDVANYKSTAQNGLFLIKYFKKLLISNKTNVSQQDFYKSYDLGKLEGKLVDRFEYFNHKSDSSALPNVLYVPTYLENKDVLYFSAKNKKRGDYDIYRITRLSDTSWSNAENLGDKINTLFDENFPFIHSDGSTLYFASKGHYSMGGYDLYKSTWSWEKNEWTEPENLDFPINSPFDDILFIPFPDKKTACFASNRESQESMLTVCNIKLELNAPYFEYSSSNQIREFAQLKVNVKEEVKIKESVKQSKKASNLVVKTVDEETFVGRSKYDSLLNRAINLQLKADSIKWLIDDKRINFENAREGQERIKIGNQIVVFEKEIYSLQKQADFCYKRVREIEQINLASKSISYDKTVVKEPKVIRENDDGVKDQEATFVEPKDDDLQRSILKVDEKENRSGVNTDQFGLRIKSPSIYNSKNPIKINETLPKGIVYLIQLGAFSSEKNPSVFKGMEPIACIKKDNSKIHKYYAGRFLSLLNAEKRLGLVKSKGFKDAYIVAFNNGKIIPINSAVKIESKQENAKGIVDEVESKTVKKESADLSIIYVLKGTIKGNNKELMSELKSNLKDNLEMYIDDAKIDDNIIIKPFKTFDEANVIKNKFENIIGLEFEIHAYFAENQIPLDQARKITQ
jgi:hypothetical protein